MPERDYTDYDYADWLRNEPEEWQGRPEPPNLYNPYVAPPQAAPPTPTSPTPPPQTGGRGMSEEEGRAYDLQNGLIGGYMTPQGWVSGSPRSGGGPSQTIDNPYLAGGDAGDFDPSSFQWTPFNPSPYGGYQEFQANPFLAPDPSQIASDPYLDFALKKGTQQLENSAAYAGMVRSGMNKKNVLEHGVNFTRQFGNDVWNRAFQGWQANEDNRFRAWGGNRQNSLDTYNTNYRGQADSFNATRDAEKMDFNARLQQWRDRLNATTQVATAGLGG